MLLSLFVMGSVGFWLLFVIVPFILLVGSIYCESYFTGTLVFVTTLTLITLFSDVNLFTWVWANPWLVAHYVLYYVAGAVLWSFIKWVLYQLDRKGEYVQQEKGYRDSYACKWKDKTPTETYTQYVADAWDQPPNIMKHKAMVTSWMAWWPASLISTVFGDLLQKLWNWFYLLFLGIYTAIGKMIYGNLIKD